MSEQVLLGKIEKVYFGMGGYQDAMFGLTLVFSMKGSGVTAFESGGWTLKRTEGTQWTEDDRTKEQSKLCWKVIDTLKKAKVSDVSKLAGVPVEITLQGNALKSWRVLEEVL